MLYTGFIFIFLLAFILTCYFLLLSLVTREQRSQVQLMAESELSDHQHDLLKWYSKSGTGQREPKRSSLEYRPDLRSFYYVVAGDGTLLDGDEALPDARTSILRAIRGWRPAAGDIQYETVRISDDAEVRLLLAGRSVYQEGTYIGTVYTGTNVTEQMRVVHVLLLVLGGLAVVFLGVSAGLGYWMAGRAMGPIDQAFLRQKEFLSDASHELRTPLSILQASVEVIEAEDRDQLSPFSQQVLADMKDEMRRMGRLVGDLLFLARSDENKLHLEKRWFLLQPLAEQIVRQFHPLAEQSQVTLQLRIAENVQVYGDAERVAQLLHILLDNAIRYNVPGGSVTVTAAKNKQTCEMQVADTGVGMTGEERAKIFERFYRADGARSREQGSNGIGLAVADWIVASHKGTVEVESTPGMGSTFTVRLPCQAAVREEYS